MCYPKYFRSIQTLLVCFAITSLANSASADVFYGPTPYLSQADIPSGFYYNDVPMGLEDFEDGSLDFGISASVGAIFGPGGFTDSVDGDDGSIDGSGSNGRAWVTLGAATGVTFSFSGPLPTAAGMVWTDGAGATTFEAWDESGVSLGTIGPFSHFDGSNAGTTGEDRFFGIQHASGISAIKLSNLGGGSMEVDHVQFGVSVPEPSSTLLLVGLAGFGIIRRRKR